MFDTYLHTTPQRTKTQFITKEIHEHRAPTDDSVKLLREMEEAAKDEIISITKLENNTLKATWHTMNDYLNNTLKIHVRIMLNGETYHIEFSLPNYYSEHDIAKECYEKIKDKIANILTIDLFKIQYTTLYKKL